MPESTCLHIQDRESGPIRVVELPWISVRIGRATYCEVSLSGEDLPEETCRLARRGRSWSLVPTAGQNSVVLEGRTIKGPCPLPFDVPFQIGRYCLTLRHDITAEPDWEIYPSSAPFQIGAPVSSTPAEFANRANDDLDRPTAAPAPEPEPAAVASRPAPDRSRWEARWKAAEAQLKSRAGGYRAASEGHGPASHSPLDASPSRERPSAAPRPSGAGTPTPLIDPKSRPIPTPRVPRIEPGWSSVRPQQPRADAPKLGHLQHDVDRGVPPVPGPAVGRFESSWSVPHEPSPAAPSPSWIDWMARERPTDPVELQEPAEPIGPDELPPDPAPPEVPSVATGSDPALRAALPKENLLEDSGFEIPDFGFEIAGGQRAQSAYTEAIGEGQYTSPFEDPDFHVPDFGIPIEELGAVREARSEDSAETQNPSTAGGGEDRSKSADQVDESSQVSTKQVGDVGRENPESDRGAEALAPEPLGSSVEHDPRSGGQSRVDERAAGEPRESLADTNRGERVRDRRAALPAKERFEDPARPPTRDPRTRRADRARTGRGIREDEAASRFDPGRSATTPIADEVIWPSVKDILVNHRASPGPKPAVPRTRQGTQPLPTVPREPGEWMLPLWIAWPPLAVSVLLVGLGACGLSWFWAVEASSAAFVTQRLMSVDGSGRRRPLPASVMPPDGRWLTTTAQHLAHWAIYSRGAPPDPNRPAPDVSSMLTRALEISPLNPTARLALAQHEPPGGRAPATVRTRGLSRDAVSLAWSARRLLDEGKKDAALRLYERALTVASSSGIPRTVTPRFHDDLIAQRYLLPGEDVVRDIVAEMAARSDWTFTEWSKALPRNPTVLLATARLFRESRREEAKPLLELILEEGVFRSPSGAVDPRALAARAEALAMGARPKDAEKEYRQAIELVQNDMIRRSWWFNLADIARRLNDESQWQTALRAAMTVERSDDISRRVISIQRAADSRSPISIPSMKAN